MFRAITSFRTLLAPRKFPDSVKLRWCYDIKRTVTTIKHLTAREDGFYENVLSVNGAAVHVRRAILDDHEAILAMDDKSRIHHSDDNVYWFMYGKLRSFLEDPMRLTWVAESEGKVASFLVSFSQSEYCIQMYLDLTNKFIQ